VNSRDEAERRIRLAERHLYEAEEATNRNDFPEAVGHSQLCVENAAKAIIACFCIPSWSHDPSEELRQAVVPLKLEQAAMAEIERLADFAHLLAPEHGRTNYGTITHLPDELYGKTEAKDALGMARQALRIARGFIRDYYDRPNNEGTYSGRSS